MIKIRVDRTVEKTHGINLNIDLGRFRWWFAVQWRSYQPLFTPKGLAKIAADRYASLEDGDTYDPWMLGLRSCLWHYHKVSYDGVWHWASRDYSWSWDVIKPPERVY